MSRKSTPSQDPCLCASQCTEATGWLSGDYKWCQLDSSNPAVTDAYNDGGHCTVAEMLEDGSDGAKVPKPIQRYSAAGRLWMDTMRLYRECDASDYNPNKPPPDESWSNEGKLGAAVAAAGTAYGAYAYLAAPAAADTASGVKAVSSWLPKQFGERCEDKKSDETCPKEACVWEASECKSQCGANKTRESCDKATSCSWGGDICYEAAGGGVMSSLANVASSAAQTTKDTVHQARAMLYQPLLETTWEDVKSAASAPGGICTKKGKFAALSQKLRQGAQKVLVFDDAKTAIDKEYLKCSSGSAPKKEQGVTSLYGLNSNLVCELRKALDEVEGTLTGFSLGEDGKWTPVCQQSQSPSTLGKNCSSKKDVPPKLLELATDPRQASADMQRRLAWVKMVDAGMTLCVPNDIGNIFSGDPGPQTQDLNSKAFFDKLATGHTEAIIKYSGGGYWSSLSYAIQALGGVGDMLLDGIGRLLEATMLRYVPLPAGSVPAMLKSVLASSTQEGSASATDVIKASTMLAGGIAVFLSGDTEGGLGGTVMQMLGSRMQGAPVQSMMMGTGYPRRGGSRRRSGRRKPSRRKRPTRKKSGARR